MLHHEHEDMECRGDNELNPVVVTLYCISIFWCLAYVAAHSYWRFAPW